MNILAVVDKSGSRDGQPLALVRRSLRKLDAELDYMISELAHDVEIILRPDINYRIAGVYGIPGELLGWQDETSLTVKIPTVSLSRRGRWNLREPSACRGARRPAFAAECAERPDDGRQRCVSTAASHGPGDDGAHGFASARGALGDDGAR